jgi:hypothetical protein
LTGKTKHVPELANTAQQLTDLRAQDGHWRKQYRRYDLRGGGPGEEPDAAALPAAEEQALLEVLAEFKRPDTATAPDPADRIGLAACGLLADGALPAPLKHGAQLLLRLKQEHAKPDGKAPLSTKKP